MPFAYVLISEEQTNISFGVSSSSYPGWSYDGHMLVISNSKFHYFSNMPGWPSSPSQVLAKFPYNLNL